MLQMLDLYHPPLPHQTPAQARVHHQILPLLEEKDILGMIMFQKI